MGESSTTAIIGGALAGLSLAYGLVERGMEPSSVTVFDRGDPHRGSNSPALMMHPFPGREVRLRRGQGTSFVRSWERLAQWRRRFGEDGWWKPGTMVRPLADDDRGQLLYDSWLRVRDRLPEPVVCQKMEASEVNDRFSGIQLNTPALTYEPAAAVIAGPLLDHLRGYLDAKGVVFRDQAVRALHREARQWHCELEKGPSWAGQQVVLAVGSALDGYFPGLDLRRRAGELLILEPPPGERLEAFVNLKTHIVQLPTGMWGLGSTYFDPTSPEERNEDEIIDILKAGVVDAVPGVADARVADLWRGERGVFGSDDMPLVGPVPNRPGLFSMAAFGSKGLLWAPEAGRALAGLLVDGENALCPHMDSRRMSAEKWGTQSRWSISGR